MRVGGFLEFIEVFNDSNKRCYLIQFSDTARLDEFCCDLEGRSRVGLS